MKDLICKECGKEFKGYKKKFCSNKCFGANLKRIKANKYILKVYALSVIRSLINYLNSINIVLQNAELNTI